MSEIPRNVAVSTSIDSLVTVELDEFPAFIPTEDTVFTHYYQRNSAMSSLIGVGTTLAGLILTYLNTGEVPGDSSSPGMAFSFFAGIGATVSYDVIKTYLDVRNFYKSIQPKTERTRFSEKLREFCGDCKDLLGGVAKRFTHRSLDQIINSLPVVPHLDFPEHEAIVLPLVAIDGILNVQYARRGRIVKKPVSFSYEFNGKKQSFSLDQGYNRVPPKPSSVVLPLGTIKDEISLGPDKGFPIRAIAHGLGLKKDGKTPLLFLYRTDTEGLSFLTAQPEVNYLGYHDPEIYSAVVGAVESIYNSTAKFRIPRRDKLMIAVSTTAAALTLFNVLTTNNPYFRGLFSTSGRVAPLDELAKVPEFNFVPFAVERRLDYQREERALSGLLQKAVSNPYASQAPKSPIDLLFDNAVLIEGLVRPDIKTGEDANIWYGKSRGNGAVISNGGHVLTNWHVVKDAISGGLQIVAIDINKNLYVARAVAVSERYDLALLKTDISGRHDVYLADVSRIKRGEPVFIGGLQLVGRVKYDKNPFRIKNKGEIRIDRFTSQGTFVGILDYEIFKDRSILANPIETKAFARGGYSGTLMADTQGRVIGITASSDSINTSASSASNIRRFVSLYLDGLRHAIANPN